MREVDFSRAMAAAVETVVLAAILAILLGFLGVAIAHGAPDSIPYWHAASLAVIVFAVSIRSAAFGREALKALKKSE